jgi:hypothetical protein
MSLSVPLNVNPSGPRPTGTGVLNGPFNGYSAPQTLTNFKNAESTMVRRILRDGWNTQYATGKVNGHARVITPFRAVNNSGDFLARQNYVCGGSTPNHLPLAGIVQRFGSMIKNCDGTGVPASNCNPRFVADSSDYTTFKKQTAINQNYNDLANGGDEHHASFVSWMAVHRF